jgi:hypothetical protein
VPDIISTDHPLTRAQQILPAALFDTLVPASDGRDAERGGRRLRYVSARAGGGSAPLLIAALQVSSHRSSNSLADRCGTRPRIQRERSAAVSSLLTRVYDCYYQNDRVRVQIGVVSGAPFPQGNQVVQGDLSLLDPVIEHSERHVYRKA